MAFPSNAGLAKAWIEMGGIVTGVKGTAQSVRDLSAAGPISYATIERLFVGLVSARAQLSTLAATPGLAAYAQAQVDDPGLNIATEIAALLAQIDDTIDWIKANLPADGNGWLLVQQINVSNQVVPRNFSSAATAGLRTILDALIATIA